MDQHLALLGQLLQHFKHAARAVLGQVAHFPAGAGAHAAALHFVVVPQRAVHQQAVAAGHDLQQRRIDLAQSRGVEQFAAGAQVFDDQADVVARVRVEAMGRVGRCGAAQGQGAETQVGAGRDAETLVEFDAVPVQAAIPVAEHGEQREAAAQVFVDHVGAPDLVRAAFTQAQQAGGVVDLAVHQDDCLHPRIAQGTTRLHRRKTLELRADVRRCVAQYPVHAVIGDRDRRLGTGVGPQTAVTKPGAVHAVTVPLRKSTAGGGT